MSINYKKNNLIIRSADINDVPKLLTLVKELAEYEKLSHLVSATEELLSYSLFSENKTAHSLIAEFKGETAGMAIYLYNFSTFLGRKGIYLEDLYVRPHLRANGIGKQILIELIKIAKESKCGRVEWSVLNWNSPAIEFYKKLGAKPMTDWTVFRLTEEKINELTN